MALNEQQILRVAEQIERAVDDELARVDNLDDDDIAEIRRKRLKQMKEMQKRKDAWLAKGHGVYTPIAEPKQFFDFAKNHERVICHFSRSATERCKVVDHHFSALAPKHWESLFCSVDVEKHPRPRPAV